MFPYFWALDLMGRFSQFLTVSGVGLVQVTVSTKSAKSDKQYVWEGEADTSVYSIREETDSDKLLPRGTVITLHLKVHLEEDTCHL